MHAKVIPVTVITGSLGSGKTTLLNCLLRSDQASKKLNRVAVIENEFGSVKLDESRVSMKESTFETVVELNEGCICCRMRGDLQVVIGKQLALRSNEVDHIFIETSGAADPAPICQTFFGDKEVSAVARLDAFVAVVDAKEMLTRIKENKLDECAKAYVEQIGFADRIVLNKVDLVTDDELVMVEQELASINRAAPIARSYLAKIPLDVSFIVGVGAFSIDRVLLFNPTFLQHPACDRSTFVTSVSIRFVGELSISKVNAMIVRLLREKGKDLLRYKGVLALRNEPRKFLFQGVHMRFDKCMAESRWRPDEPRENRVVVTGRNIDKAQIESDLKACILREGGPLRFSVGSRVLANTENGWVPGYVVLCWDGGRPYRIRLDKRLRSENKAVDVWAPDDHDMFVKELL